MGKWAKERERGDADGSAMTQIRGDSVVVCLYAIARSISLTAVRSEKFFRGKVSMLGERSLPEFFLSDYFFVLLTFLGLSSREWAYAQPHSI